MSRVTLYNLLVAEDVVPVVAVLPTGTEGGDEVLGYSEAAARCGKVLLAQPAGGAVVVFSILLNHVLGILSNPVGLCYEYLW